MGACQTLSRLEEMEVRVNELKAQFDKVKTNLDEIDRKKTEIETNFKTTQNTINKTVENFSGNLTKPISDLESSSKMLMDMMKGGPKKGFF